MSGTYSLKYKFSRTPKCDNLPQALSCKYIQQYTVVSSVLSHWVLPNYAVVSAPFKKLRSRKIQPWHAHQGSEDVMIIPDNHQKGLDKVRYLAQSCEFLLQGLISVAWCRLGAQETSNSEKWRVSLQADHCHWPRSLASGRSACKLTLHFSEFEVSCAPSLHHATEIKPCNKNSHDCAEYLTLSNPFWWLSGIIIPSSLP